MADKELLEFAARAAGYEVRWSDGPTSFNYTGFRIKTGKLAGCQVEIPDQWNPLEDDGDALRLAVKLGAIVGTYQHYSTVDLLFPNERIETITVWHSETQGDPYTAARRAITRAAAAIGKAMPSTDGGGV